MPRHIERFELLHLFINFSFNKYRENNSNCEAVTIFSRAPCAFLMKSPIAKGEINFTRDSFYVHRRVFFKIDRVDRQGRVDRLQEDGRLGGAIVR